MKNPIYTVAALALIVGSGLVHGAWTKRWRTAPALAELAARLESVPTVLEDWTATSQAIDPRELAMAGAVGHELRSFRPPSPAGQGPNHPRLRLYWAWHGSSGWSAPENPRWAFAAEPMLSKLYIVRETGGVAVDPKEDLCAQFLSLLLPELDRVMSPSGQGTGAKTPDKLK